MFYANNFLGSGYKFAARLQIRRREKKEPRELGIKSLRVRSPFRSR